MQQQFLAHFVIDIIGIAHFIYIYVYGSEMICNLTCDNRLLMMIPPKMRLVPLFFFFFFFVQNALVFVILIIEYSRAPPPPVPKARFVWSLYRILIEIMSIKKPELTNCGFPKKILIDDYHYYYWKVSTYIK